MVGIFKRKTRFYIWKVKRETLENLKPAEASLHGKHRRGKWENRVRDPVSLREGDAWKDNIVFSQVCRRQRVLTGKHKN